MKYRLKIAEVVTNVNVLKAEGDGSLHLTIDNKEYDVPFQAVGETRYHLAVNGKTVEVFVARGEDGKHVFIKGKTFFVQDADQLPLRRARLGEPEETPGEVTPPMPAVVVRVMVKEGDHVTRGQPLMVVTAMKMETTLVAPRDGTVKRINTSINAKVTPGDVLVEIQEEAKDNG
jgi:3-methylcrotonyl-CoA carboxylase alpha subunit